MEHKFDLKFLEFLWKNVPINKNIFPQDEIIISSLCNLKSQKEISDKK